MIRPDDRDDAMRELLRQPRPLADDAVRARQSRIGCVGRGADRIERGAEARFVIRDRHDHAPRCPLFPRGDLAPADGAEPGEEGRLAAPRTEVAHGGNERGLDDVFGGVRIPQAQDREAEQPGKIVREEFVERTFIAAEHAPDQFALAAVVHLDLLEGPTIPILRDGPVPSGGRQYTSVGHRKLISGFMAFLSDR